MMMISVYSLSRDAISIRCPSLSHKVLQRYSPIPVDACPFLPFSPVKDFSNTRGQSCLGIPIPLSRICSFTQCFWISLQSCIHGSSSFLYFTAIAQNLSQHKFSHFRLCTHRQPLCLPDLIWWNIRLSLLSAIALSVRSFNEYFVWDNLFPAPRCVR